MITLRALIVLLCLLAAFPAVALSPPYVPDVELATSPLIVVGRWRADADGAKRDSDRFHTAGPGYLTVERVVIGNIQPGEYRLVAAPDSLWNSKGKPTHALTEYFTQLEVDDATKSNLWFVSPSKPFAGHENEPTLRTTTGRAVQHLSLEQFYLILRNPDRDSRIAESLQSRDSMTLLRAMRFVMGDKQPWPYDTELLTLFDEYRVKARKRLPAHAERVAALIPQPDLAVRRAAAATYAVLAGRAAVLTMRQLLRNADAETRLIAVGVLAKWKDINSARRFADAIRGFSEPGLGCAVIERLKSWPEGAVPALMTFLETDGWAGQIGDYLYVPAIQARKSLFEITRFTFPLNVARSESAWRAASHIASSTEQRKKLASFLGDCSDPLSAEVFNIGPPRIVVRNRSSQPITITRRPPGIGMNYHSGDQYSSGTYGWPTRNFRPGDFITLKPGASITVGLAEEYNPEFASGPVQYHRIVLTYTTMGKSFGKHAWIGHVNVHFGRGWKQRPDKAKRGRVALRQ